MSHFIKFCVKSSPKFKIFHFHFYISLTEDVPQKKIRDNSLKSSHPTPHAKDKTPSSQVGMLITFARSVKITLYFTKFIWVCQKIVI